MGIAEMSYDGKYLYLYNGRMGTYAKSNEKTELTRKCAVLATDGTVLYDFRLTKQDICCLEMGIIFLPNRL